MTKKQNTIICSVCEKDTSHQYALLITKWLEEHTTDYEIFLCESCFFNAHAHLRAQKKLLYMFEKNFDYTDLANLGLKQK